MSPTTVTPPMKSRTSRRWNNIVNSDRRRSQSLNSMSKSSSTEALRSTTSLGTFVLQDDEQSSYTSANTEEYDQHYPIPISPSRSTHSRQISNNTPPPSRPARSAPRLWEDLSESSGQKLSNHVYSLSQSSSQSISTPESPDSPRSPKSVVSKFSTWKEKSFAGRRKGSVADLELGSDRYNPRSFNPDSPSLPQIYSANTVMSLGLITPRPQSREPTQSEVFALRTPEWQEKDQKRASSMLLPSGLAPIVVTPIPSRIPTMSPINITIPNKSGIEDNPPRPPPKSPRTLLRAFPSGRPVALPGRHTPNSSIHSISPTETPMTAGTTWSPVSVYSATSTNTPDTFNKSPPIFNNTTQFEDSYQRTTAPAQNLKIMPYLNHNRSASNSQTDHRLPRNTSPPVLGGDRPRMMSESSVMNRGRPKKRGDSVVWQRSPMKANDNGQLIPKNQTCRISLSELHTLRNYAEDRVSNHDILTQMQVTELNQELKALDESYISIQRTISELKESRKAAYLSMKSYLESSSSSSPSGNTTSMRDHFMKQTKALYELDTQLDALQSKLDSAAERRLTIQSKVWEHLTAILTATTLVGGVGRSEEYTPPRSPERFTGRRLSDAAIQEDEDAIYNSSPRNDIESITIFADSGVANLLRSIEEELDVIDQFRYQDDEEINAFEKDAQFCMI